MFCQLFWTFFKVSLCAIGGAYAFLPLLQNALVKQHGWLTQYEFVDLLGLVEIFPGAISIKFATYTGYKMGGIPGVIAANLGNLITPVTFVLLASIFYNWLKNIKSFQGSLTFIRLAVCGLILGTAFQLFRIHPVLHLAHYLIIIASFGLFCYVGVHPALLIIAAGLAGYFLS